MKEIGRVLKPGGIVVLSTSNRYFPTKVVRIWSRTNDVEHILIYGSYVHYSGYFEPPEGFDLSANALNPTAKLWCSISPTIAAIVACGVVDFIGGRGFPALIAGVLAYIKCPGSPDPVYVVQARKIQYSSGK
eukprot:gnl/TRDRNA2_/TRDRNA2_49100_c1_seq1.p1 gnl/TRDRNA2_/TRDRNA2_49100_c1~~gnl/TRDRNA2_/TRDRNA2_49100_c1_seq1.p1  ORF type:complete len:150 (-),score=7.08 gnl/TRDRNA2_/TRDRNA2_49100_c1_seq1:301-696(-)